ncbi:MAG: hypothetical protein U1C46_08575 [Bacteroidales bacterium]|nr:hypothetical protein [Bacteroidales bacterium]MDZ4204856.1 hypothetical protein [Bacteroidales bacterium]
MTLKRQFKSFLLILGLLFSYSGMAHEIRIRGSAPGAEGALVEIICYSDLITWTQVRLAAARVTQNGQFELVINLAETRLTLIRIRQQQAEIILEPGNAYHFKITNILRNQTHESEMPGYLVPPLEVEITNALKHELNGLLKQFNSVSDEFMALHFPSIARHGNKEKVNEYKQLVYDHFPGINNAWFNNTLYYSIANLKLMTRSSGKETLVSEYLRAEPILYHHPEYIQFFTAIFDKYLLAEVGSVKKPAIKSALEAANAYQELMSLLASDPLLKQEHIRELVLLTSSWDLYSSSYFNKENVARAIKYISGHSQISEHRTIATNMLSLLGL